MPPIHKENLCKSCQSVKPTLGYHKCTPQDNQEKSKCCGVNRKKCAFYCNEDKGGHCGLCGKPFEPSPVSKEEEITKDNWEEHYPIPKEEVKCCFKCKDVPDEPVLDCKLCDCHTHKEETTSEWEVEIRKVYGKPMEQNTTVDTVWLIDFIKSQISKATLQVNKGFITGDIAVFNGVEFLKVKPEDVFIEVEKATLQTKAEIVEMIEGMKDANSKVFLGGKNKQLDTIINNIKKDDI